MVILIGGTSGAGKTKLAHTLMMSLGIPYVSVDHLMMGICRSNADCGFTPMSDVATLNRHLWPIVREMIKTNIENEHSIIFEGFQILPHNIKEFTDEYTPELLSFFLVLSPEYIEAHYADINDHRSAIETRSDVDDPHTMARNSARLIDDCVANSANLRLIGSVYEEELQAIAQEIASAFALGRHRRRT